MNGKDKKNFKAENNQVSVDMHHMPAVFTILKHDKMVLHSNCWINFSMNEKAAPKG